MLAWLEPQPGLMLCQHFQEVLEVTRGCPRVAVDMPIGLNESGQIRQCDRLVRQRLGVRRASLFPAPARSSLQCTDYDQVRGTGMSLQTFYLLPKIRQLDEALCVADQQRVVECHPELLWTRRSGQPLALAKKSADGLELRRRPLPAPLPEVRWPRKLVQPDDVVDALGLALAATDQLRGQGWCFPERPQYDERGLRMEIWG